MTWFKKKEPATSPVDKLQYLPTNAEDLEEWMREIVDAFHLPDTDDTREIIATMIMHMPPTAARAPQRYFGESVYKGMSNKAAYTLLEEYRERRKQAEAEAKRQAEEEAKANQPAETQPGVSDGPPESSAGV